MNGKPTIQIFAMGGTIDKSVFSYDSLSYVVGEPQIARIIEQSNIRFEFSIESIVRKDSLELTEADRSKLLSRVKEVETDKIVITHGTDTVTQTAEALREVSDKTIVFTGSIYPAKFYDTDADFNIGGSIVAAQILPPGFYLIMNGLVLDPFQVQKNIDSADYSKK